MQLQKMMVMACALLERTQLQSCFATSLLISQRVFIYFGRQDNDTEQGALRVKCQANKRSRQVIDSQ